MVNLEKNVNEVVEDLKTKIDGINEAAEDVEGDAKVKVNEIKDKAVSVLDAASEKVVETYKSITDSEEVKNCIDVVKSKSKKLYDRTIAKIDEIKKSKAYQDAGNFVNKTVDQVKSETGAFIYNTKENIDDFFAKEEVKNNIDKAKLKTVGIAEKGLEILKQWLKPGEDRK